MDGTDWLRTQLSTFACERCGRTYLTSHIRVLAQRDDLFVVDFDCRSCGSRAVAFVTVEIESTEDGEEHGSDLIVETEPGQLPAPVGSDDVLDMHLFLRDFDGDFRRALDSDTG